MFNGLKRVPKYIKWGLVVTFTLILALLVGALVINFTVGPEPVKAVAQEVQIDQKQAIEEKVVPTLVPVVAVATEKKVAQAVTATPQGQPQPTVLAPATQQATPAFTGLSLKAETLYNDTNWLAEPALMVVGAQVPLRMSGVAQRNYFNIATLPVGTFVFVLRNEPKGENGTMKMVRAYQKDGKYIGFGWVSESAAKLTNPPSELPTFVVPECSSMGTEKLIVSFVAGAKRATKAMVAVSDFWALDTLATNCNLLFEGRQELTNVHHIWVLRHRNGANGTQYLKHNIFVAVEGSYWYVDPNWNMQDDIPSEPPIAKMFVNGKKENMKKNVTTPHEFPIIVHKTDGTTEEFGIGATAQGVNTRPSCETFTEPQQIEVAGIFDSASGKFNASIGATGCRMVVFGQVDGDPAMEIDSWVGAADNYVFMTLVVYELPLSWNNQQAVTFVMDYVKKNFTAGTKVEASTGAQQLGLPASFDVK